MGLGLASASAQLVLVNDDFSGPETPNQLGYYNVVGPTHDPSASNRLWNRSSNNGGRLQNNPAEAVNNILWRSFDGVTLQNVGDWITLSIAAGFTSTNTGGNGLVVGFFDRSVPLTENVAAGDNALSAAGDQGYVFRQYSNGTNASLNAAQVRSSTTSPNTFPGYEVIRTGEVTTSDLTNLTNASAGVFDGIPITLTLTITSTGLMVTGTQNGIEMDPAFFEGVTSFNANSVFIRAQASPGAGYIDYVNVTAIPEPSTYALIFGALIGVIAWIRRKRMS